MWKENNRLFMMADMRLKGVSDTVGTELDKSETDLLDKIVNTMKK
ncbi:MAG: cation-binding protein [Cenarchaeum symbiont of Oopsacas minuta]|nr:cation-binding protein [Cenarchaeum symbiont of Oopsacas minuta]